jgi:hypothetical protein
MIGMLDYIIKANSKSDPDFAAMLSRDGIQAMRGVILETYEQIYPSIRDDPVMQKEIISSLYKKLLLAETSEPVKNPFRGFTCGSCGKYELEGTLFQKCGGCLVRRYCSRECQVLKLVYLILSRRSIGRSTSKSVKRLMKHIKSTGVEGRVQKFVKWKGENFDILMRVVCGLLYPIDRFKTHIAQIYRCTDIQIYRYHRYTWMR